MAANKVTFSAKVKFQDNPLPITQQMRALDVNELREVINDNADILDNLTYPITAVSSDISPAVKGRQYNVTTGSTDKTITLPASPVINDSLTVSKRDSGIGQVIIDGNGKQINQDTEIIIQNQNTVVTFKYDGSEWNII